MCWEANFGTCALNKQMPLLNGCCESLLRAALLLLQGRELKHQFGERSSCFFLAQGQQSSTRAGCAWLWQPELCHIMWPAAAATAAGSSCSAQWEQLWSLACSQTGDFY